MVEPRPIREHKKKFEEHKKQTNADRIRSFSDEELAEYLSELIRNASDYITDEGNWLQWLKSEAKE